MAVAIAFLSSLLIGRSASIPGLDTVTIPEGADDIYDIQIKKGWIKKNEYRAGVVFQTGKETQRYDLTQNSLLSGNFRLLPELDVVGFIARSGKVYYEPLKSDPAYLQAFNDKNDPLTWVIYECVTGWPLVLKTWEPTAVFRIDFKRAGFAGISWQNKEAYPGLTPRPPRVIGSPLTGIFVERGNLRLPASGNQFVFTPDGGKPRTFRFAQKRGTEPTDSGLIEVEEHLADGSVVAGENAGAIRKSDLKGAKAVKRVFETSSKNRLELTVGGANTVYRVVVEFGDGEILWWGVDQDDSEW